jgi:hypothetical protein
MTAGFVLPSCAGNTLHAPPRPHSDQIGRGAGVLQADNRPTKKSSLQLEAPPAFDLTACSDATPATCKLNSPEFGSGPHV